tara:strand:+ start:471 stop:758 length:288 start_codon:yes stop_codon:yes gene_type:complete
MKKIVVFTFLFSFLLILLTFLNYKIEVIETKIIDTEIINKKLEKDLAFLKSEWEYLNSPENISHLSKKHLHHKPAELIEFRHFMKLLSNERHIDE